ncbi:pilus assembly protein [Sphingomonas sp. BN140010]|uniref:Pilus assembly protein n=1 Tax=Sphingomonas arvum TaxID=2992113 RepID=A0ABT3JHU0_9SPHN|nr:TadE/TadG family type IV pilus assembly protein [Sphingomonas sp. BN140010]MCW3798648.1 pilus assembly protein [Sphingomonas sp. BN140010]
MTKRKLLQGQLIHHEDGAAAVEFAFALPILIMFIWGIAQFGMILAADAGMQHALGEGARMATLWPQPTNAAVKQRIQDNVFGNFLGSYTVSDPVASTSTAVNNQYVDLQVTYTVTPDFLFWQGSPINFVRSKRVYVTKLVTASSTSSCGSTSTGGTSTSCTTSPSTPSS